MQNPYIVTATINSFKTSDMVENSNKNIVFYTSKHTSNATHTQKLTSLVIQDPKREENQEIIEWLQDELTANVVIKHSVKGPVSKQKVTGMLLFSSLNDALKFKFQFGDYLVNSKDTCVNHL